MQADIRPTAVAGRFYPAAPEALAREIDAQLALAASAPSAASARPPKLLLVPHAGTVYSGPIAAHAYELLRRAAGRIRRVVLLGPAHRVPLHGLAAPSVAAFDSPLGALPVDREALAAIAGLPQVHTDDRPHALEHALEVQLPFLQRVLDDGFAIVPLLVGRASPAQVDEVIEALWGGDETLIVISSDLSHYQPYDAARAHDAATIARVLALDPSIDHPGACGATPLAGALLAARRHGLRPRLLDLRNSGDTAGDRRSVVGYAAVAFDAASPAQDVTALTGAARVGAARVGAAPTGAAQAGAAPGEAEPVAATPAAAAPAEPASIGAAQAGADTDAAPRSSVGADAALGEALLAHARDAIATALGLAGAPAPEHPALDAAGATFVTLHHAGALRGCVGTLQACEPLRIDVRRHALAAAFEDSRFTPLSQGEFDGLRIEVSLLDAPEPLAVAGEDEARRRLRPGVDGVVLEWRGHRATLLPQVWAQLPAPADFLCALKQKAGLAEDFWHAELRMSRYRVRKFAHVEPG